MLRTLIQFTALLQATISAFFLVKGAAGMSVKDIAQLSSTKCGYNLNIAKNLTGQKADVTVGSALLSLSIVLQVGNFLWEMRIDDFGVSRAGIIIAIIASIFIFFIAYRVSCWLQQKWHKQSEEILKRRSENQNTEK